MANQFGEHSMVTLAPHSLCVPSEIDSVPSALDLDHFACYRVAQLRTPRHEVTLSDQFESRRTRVLKPYLLCNAVDKNGEGVKNARALSHAYKIRNSPGEGQSTLHGVSVDNQFGSAGLRVTRPRTLCVPRRSCRARSSSPRRSPARRAAAVQGSSPALTAVLRGAVRRPVAGNKIADLGLGCLPTAAATASTTLRRR